MSSHKKRKLNRNDTVMTVSDTIGTDDATGNVINVNYTFRTPKLCHVKLSPIDRMLVKGKKLNYLNTTTSGASGVIGTTGGYGSSVGRCNYYSLGTLSAAVLISMENVFDDAYPNIDASGNQDTIEKAVYLHGYTFQQSMINCGNTAINIELYDVVPRQDTDAGSEPHAILSDTTSELALVGSGYNQNAYAAGLGSAGIAKIAYGDDDYHWSLNHNFCRIFKVCGTKRFTLPPGGTLKVRINHHIRQMVSQRGLSARDGLLHAGIHGVMMRQIGQLVIGGAKGITNEPPNYADTAMGFYRKVLQSGVCFGSAVEQPISGYGKTGVADDGTLFHIFDDNEANDAELVGNV